MPLTTPYVLIAISNVARANSFRQIASESLRLEGVVVRDGDDAMEEISRRGMPALLVVDLSLPRMDGFTVVRRVRRTPSDTPTRVIVVSAHESLRAAARELSASLGISGILPLDAEASTLRDMIFAGLDPTHSDQLRTSATAADAVSNRPQPLDHEEIVERAAVGIRRRFRLPVSVGYLRVGDREGLTFHVAAREGEQVVDLNSAIDVAVLRQVAESSEPLVVPSVESHPVFAQMAGTANKSVRGFAAVPIPSGRESVRASLCLMDTQPLALTAADIDALSACGRQTAIELDHVAVTAPERKASVVDMPDDVEALQHLASTDPLTGIANRRGGEKHIGNESRARSARSALSAAS
ncbi:MAG: response regulator [Vicinamibacterales bacterium]